MLKHKIHIYSLIITFCFAISYAQQSSMHFKRFNIDHGLSQNTINTLYEDREGFIWIGTDDGINRFDGINFKLFYFDLHNNNSISNNQVNSILEDSNDDLWIATANGLNKLDRANNLISRYYKDEIQGISNNYITKLKALTPNSFLIATYKSISIYNCLKKEFSPLVSIKDDTIFDFIIDKKGNLWIATENKLLYYSIENQELTEKTPFATTIKYQKLLLDLENNLWVGSNIGIRKIDSNLNDITPKKLLPPNLNTSVTSIFEDRSGYIWIGTEDGLNSYNPITNTHNSYRNNSNDLNSISNNSIYTILQDNSGTLWLGTFQGLNSLMLNQKNFNHVSLFPNHTDNLSTNLIWCFTKDKAQNLWIGTANGLHVYNETQNRFKSISIENIDDKLKRSIFYVYIDSYGNLWTGGNYGAHYLESETVKNIWNKKSVSLKKITSKPLKDIINITKYIETPNKKEMWIGTIDDGVLNATNTNEDPNQIKFKQLKHKENIPLSLPDNTATNLISLKSKDRYDVWVGTRKGLSKYNPTTQNFTTYNFNSNKNIDLQISAINSFNDSILWIGTFNSGLIKFNLNTEEHQYINAKNGLANNSIYGILNHKNELWLSTNRGLSKYNIETHAIKNYDKSYGLQDNEFGEGAFYKDKTNKLYFGGLNGYNAFYSEDILVNKIPPKINFIDFKVFDKTVLPNISNSDLKLSKDKAIILKKSVAYTDTINLSYKHSVFSFKVAIIHNKNSTKNIYAYKLSSIDKDWNIRNSTNNEFTYTNLNPGNYLLQVKAANSDGIWSKPKMMNITIHPPYWKTYWFYSLSSLLILISIFTFLHFWKKQIKLAERRDFHKKENEQKTAMIKEIHHRVKNNLQVINSFLRVQASKIEDKEVVTMLKKTQNRVLSMAVIHEKMYQTKNLHSLNAQEHFEPLIRDLIEAYGINKDIDLDIKITPIDFEMDTLTPLALIINELISNSLKYAFKDLKKGIIKIHLNKTTTPDYYQLLIGDNGSGYDLSEITTSKQIGTKLIASFVRQLSGSITLLEEPGTHFEILFYSKKKSAIN